MDIGGVKHWLWRTIDEYGAVLDVFFQNYRDTEAAKSLLHRLLGEHDVPEAIHTHKLWSFGAALWKRPVLHEAEHVAVVLTPICNNLIEQRAGVLERVRSAQDDSFAPHGAVFSNSGVQVTTTGARFSRPARPDHTPLSRPRT